MLLVAWCLNRKRSAERASPLNGTSPFSPIIEAAASAQGGKGSRGCWLLLSIMAALLFGGLVGLNFHVITGFDAQHTHFYNRLLQPLGCFFAPLAVLAWLDERDWRSLLRATAVAIGAASVLLLCLGLYRQARVGIDTAVHHRASDSRMATLLWIREHLPPQTVIGSSDDRLFLLIPAVTGNWTFVPMGLRSMAPTREILLRYLLLSALEGKQWHEIRDTLTRKRLGDTFGSVIVQPMIGAVQLSPRALAMVESMWNHGKLDRELAARKLDFLIVEAERPLETMRLRNPKTIFVNHDWRVLDVREAGTQRTVPGGTAPD
jgi:hypothetical protein